jgi:hypothetical protein
MPRRTLKTIASWINENLPELHATVEKSWSNTDRQIPGTRLRHPGKGRHGTRPIVRMRDTNESVFNHDSSETYRSNSEVESWLEGWIGRTKTS